MNTNTPTPRTDAAEQRDITGLGVVPVDFARQLERELADYRARTKEIIDEDHQRILALIHERYTYKARAEDALARAESATPAPQSPAIDAESLIAACIPGGSICDPQQVADAIREYLRPQEPCGGRCGDPDCNLDTMGVSMRAPAPHAGTAREWNAGTPDVPLGAMRRLWCAALADNGKTYHSMLCYANGYAMQLADWVDEIPDCCKPIPGDEDNLAWFGWYEESCDNCETQWHSSANVIAWMELPRFDAAMKGGAK